jgi:hypothetical protein
VEILGPTERLRTGRKGAAGDVFGEAVASISHIADSSFEVGYAHTLKRLGKKRGAGRRFHGEKVRWRRRGNASYLFRNIGGEVEEERW